jgi:hypothetical protein
LASALSPRPGAQYPVVFRVVGTGAITAYAVGVIPNSI